MSKDQIYTQASAAAGSFEFDDRVANVFPDMLRRSIPGYDLSIHAIGQLAASYVRPGTRCYDLGCSLGAATLAMRHGITSPDCSIVAIDTSPAMTSRCQALIDADASLTPCTVLETDIRNVTIENASMVVMNYTLQFLPVRDRLEMLRIVCAGLNPGGILVLSEKVADEDPGVNDLLIELHHNFKKANAYSDLEISRKRTALENVLIPETIDTHLNRLSDAGFSHSGVWLKHFNFASILAIR